MKKAPLGWLAILVIGSLTSSLSAEQIVSPNSTWRYFKATSEASDPTNAWRLVGFDDSSWLTGNGPFHFGTNAAGGDDDQMGGTILNDMPDNYSCIFMRQEFTLDTNALTELTLGFYIDDGLVAWINGVPVRHAAIRPNQYAYNAYALSPREAFYFDGAIPYSMLQNGTNVLAIQAFNYQLDDPDFRVEAQLTATLSDIEPPVIVSVFPPPGATLSTLTEITVTFNEPVLGAAAGDLSVNGTASEGVSGSDRVLIYSVSSSGIGAVQVTWNSSHSVTDTNSNRFDETAPEASWTYTMIDSIAPAIVATTPERDSVLENLSQIQIDFSEPVQGVDAADLLMNGQSATQVTPAGLTGYLFAFPAAPSGGVVISWNVNHQITDLAAIPNAFLPDAWSYVVLPPVNPNQVAVVPNSAPWRYLKGLNEASSPTNFWRDVEFDASSWNVANAPFHYGTNTAGGDDDLTGGTLLSDMKGSYSSLFLRKEFNLVTEGLTEVNLTVEIDEGFAAFINGQFASSYLVNLSKLAYTDTTTFPFPREVASIPVSLPLGLFRNGQNVLAIQAVNKSKTDEDFRINAELIAQYPDTGEPLIVGTIPPRNTSVTRLTQITVVFDEPVAGMDAQDFRINGDPPVQVIGTSPTNRFTFIFNQPAPGDVSITWDDAHGISDELGHPFDALAPESHWNYALADLASPEVQATVPVAGAQVRVLSQSEVVFSEPVTGVDAADLLVNGIPAVSVSGAGNGPYVFQFDPPSAGTVPFTWAAGHGITDLAASPNAFAGGSWTALFEPNSVADVVINEFLASNVATNNPLDLDEDGELQDWLELWNRGSNSVHLLGWSLSDNPAQPGQWTFPDITLGPGEYLLVYTSGKDRRPASGAKLHTNWRLNINGEYLALFSADSPRVAHTLFESDYPEQRNDYSYGRDGSNKWRYYATPTPLAANGASSITGVAPKPHVSVQRGLFDRPFALTVTSTQPGATLRYTQDGSEPTPTSGTLYSGPLTINQTTVFRVAAFHSSLLPSLTETRTYLFPDQVIHQPSDPAGFPASWGTSTAGGFPNNIVPADYEMDPEVVDDPAYRDSIKEGLMSLPVLSVVMSVDDMFGAARGIYSHVSSSQTQYRGPDWERSCSAEFILPNGQTGFQINCGIQMQGNASRDPHKQPKHSLRLMFKGAYGPGKLEYEMFPGSPVKSFDTLVLRGEFNDAWTHWDPNQRLRGQRIRDVWAKDTMRAMGSLAGHSRYVHLYINGLYWGVYDPSERIDSDFAASYLGGDASEYDAIVAKPTEAIDGDLIAYNEMRALSNLGDLNQYNRMLEYLDMVQFVDYMLLNFFGANQDWGLDGNWNAVRRRNSGGTFKYIPWDNERILEGNNDNRVTNTDVPSGLHTKLRDSAEYRLAFADRVHKHLFNGGALTPESASQRYLKRAQELDLAIIAESARWGDYRRDVHSFQNAPYYLYTKNEYWTPERDRILQQYFPARTGIVLNQLRNAGLYPNVTAPSFSQHGGRIPQGFQLAISAPAGAIYFTTDGSDPRAFGTSAVSATANAYAGNLTLNRTTLIKSRVLSNGTWSALNEATFTVEDLLPAIRITEIMYNPLPGGGAGEPYEFVEIQNVGGTLIDLSGYQFDGIDFEFTTGSIINPGVRLVLGSAANTNSWKLRYPGVAVQGWFLNRLSNSGEQLALYDASGIKVVSVDYSDGGGWPTAADGHGASLEIIDPNGDPDDPANWRASLSVNGSPGLPPAMVPASDIVLNEFMADNISAVTNGGAVPDWIELYNRGTGPVELAGWSLTDDGNARKFVIPAGISLNAGDYLVIWCDLAASAPGLHSGFSLDRAGESLFLFDANSNRVDAISFGPQVADQSLGRIAGQWQLTVPTPGGANQAASLASASQLVINEWLADAPPGGSDWVELYNTSPALPVALKGIFLATSNTVFQLKSHSFIAPGGFIQLSADEAPGPDHLDFKLPKEGGVIVLFDRTAAEVHRVTYGSQMQSVSEGLLPNGSATIEVFVSSVSPAASNYVVNYNGPILNEVMARNQSAVLSPLGQYADWVELANPNPEPYDLSGLALSDSASDPNQWVFPAGTSIPGNGFLLVWCDDSRPATTDNGAMLNTGFALNRESGGVYLFNGLGQRLNQVEYGFQVRNLSIGLSAGEWHLLSSPTPGAANSESALLGAVSNLRLNEFMADPASGNDWFELYNPDAAPVDLSGLYLTDNPSVFGVTNYQVGPLSFIGGRSWVLWQADNDPRQGRNHVNFALDALGETLRLYSAAGSLIDAIDFGMQSTNASMGALPDGGIGMVSFPASASPEHANYLPLTNVVINEVLTHTDDPLEDAIELRNQSGSPVPIGNWYLSNSESDLKRYRIPTGTQIGANELAVFYAYQFDTNGGQPPSFGLNSAHGGQVFLSAANAIGDLTGYRSMVEFGAAENGVSIGRYPTSLGEDFVALSQRTFGVDTPSSLSEFRSGTGLANAYPWVGPVVISEIMFHPASDVGGVPTELADEEFLELRNISETSVDLYDSLHPTNRWKLGNAVNFEFPAGSNLGPDESALVVRFDPVANPAALASFRSHYGITASGKIFGPWTGRLSNEGESVELYKPDAPQTSAPDAGFVPYILVDRVNYLGVAPWYAEADGTGNSLQRVELNQYGNDPLNWTAAAPTPGPKGELDTDGDGMPDSYEDANGLNRLVNDANGDLDEDGMSNIDEFRAGTLANAPQSALRATITFNGSTILSFTAMANRAYVVEYRDSLDSGEWHELATIEAAAETRLEPVTDPAPENPRFYRLRLAMTP